MKPRIVRYFEELFGVVVREYAILRRRGGDSVVSLVMPARISGISVTIGFTSEQQLAEGRALDARMDELLDATAAELGAVGIVRRRGDA